jgi:pyruvate carboxylase
MRVAIDAVRENGKLCEAAICFSGNLSDPKESKYTLDYYLALASDLKSAGAHIIAIKDMAGLCRPHAAHTMVRAIKDETGLPVHFHTHDTSGIAAASVLAAVDAGVDAIDAAMDSMSGLTSQPNLGSIVEALRHDERDTGLAPDYLRTISEYWDQVRRGYVAFEPDIRSGASEVYVHGMPGGQYTNLKEQALALGIESARWPEVANAYTEVNDMFGDIVKVTPTSKVVGDMAIMMVVSDISREQVEDPATEVSFPQSVVELFRGELGQAHGGFPAELQKKILKNTSPIKDRPGDVIAPVDLEETRNEAKRRIGRDVTDNQLASYLMYPEVFDDYARDRASYGDIAMLPTSVFFYGMEPGSEISVDIERGKTLILRYVAVSDAHDDGSRTVFFELNGEPRSVRVIDRQQIPAKPPVRQAEADNPDHVGAPMPGKVISVSVKAGDTVERGTVLLTLEAMKMEATVCADLDGTVVEVLVGPGSEVDARDLLAVLEHE